MVKPKKFNWWSSNGTHRVRGLHARAGGVFLLVQAGRELLLPLLLGLMLLLVLAGTILATTATTQARYRGLRLTRRHVHCTSSISNLSALANNKRTFIGPALGVLPVTPLCVRVWLDTR